MSRDADAFAPFGVPPDKPARRPAGFSRKKRWVGWLLAFLAGLLTLGVLALHSFQGALSCSQDTSDCVDTREVNAFGSKDSDGVPLEVDPEAAWYEAYDLDASWQYRSVFVVGLLGLGLLVVAVVLPASLRTKVRNAGVVVCLTGTALWVFVWSM